ncbi:MAG: transporter [Bacteroidia bacterium]|nr:transporter [Bacteroidia bacterium]
MAVLMTVTKNTYGQCACCTGAGAGSSGGDYLSNTLTLKKKQFIFEGYTDYRTIMVEEKGGGHDMTDTLAPEETPLKSMMINSLGIRYGISNRFTVSATLPYVLLNTTKGKDRGLGDLILLGTFNVFKKNMFSLALSGGVELPTGVQKGSKFDETTVVVGSGSIDPMAGISFLKVWNRLSLQGNALYRYTTKGFDDITYSSISFQNVGLAYSLKGHNNSCQQDTVCNSHTVNWSVFGGYYGEYLSSIKEADGEYDENSGYYVGFATLGTAISAKGWSVPLTLSIPIIQQMNGDQNMAGFRLRIGIVKRF